MSETKRPVSQEVIHDDLAHLHPDTVRAQQLSEEEAATLKLKKNQVAEIAGAFVCPCPLCSARLAGKPKEDIPTVSTARALNCKTEPADDGRVRYVWFGVPCDVCGNTFTIAATKVTPPPAALIEVIDEEDAAPPA